jgi:uncharacterized protein (DUF433 family)
VSRTPCENTDIGISSVLFTDSCRVSGSVQRAVAQILWSHNRNDVDSAVHPVLTANSNDGAFGFGEVVFPRHRMAVPMIDMEPRVGASGRMLEEVKHMRRVVTNRAILGGKPVLEGTRISVEQILGLLANGQTPAQIVDSYPILNEDDIRTAIGYARAALKNDLILDVA